MSTATSYQEFLQNEAMARSRRRHPLRLLAIFLLIFFALQYAWETSRGSELERVVIDRATVAPAAGLINLLWPGQGVTSRGHRIVSPDGRLNILNGCEGLETLFLLIAALAAYPFCRRARLLGLALALPLVFALNQVRIVALWHAFIHARSLFGVFHGVVLPMLMVAICLMCFLVFVERYAATAD